MQQSICPSKELLAQVRAAFVVRGTSMSAWCRENGVARQNARLSLLGGWDGPKGKALRARIVEAAGTLV